MRASFPLGQQGYFLEIVQRLTGASAEDLASQVGVCARTFRDWQREKWQMSDDALDRLCRFTQLPRPADVTLLPEHWSTSKAGRLGGLHRTQLYGAPGTPEGRRRGGLTTQAAVRQNPALARQWGLQTRKVIQLPEHSEEFAEFIGIFLGDGGFRSAWQIGLAFNYRADGAYTEFLIGLVHRLFHLEAVPHIREGQSGDLYISSATLVEFLERELGVARGRKSTIIKQLPEWIISSRSFQIACLRGLMDTDGCVYQHRYRVNGKWYAYPKMGFAGTIPSICQFVEKTLQGLGIPAHLRQSGQRVFVDSVQAVRKYFATVGTHNPRYQARFEEYSTF